MSRKPPKSTARKAPGPPSAPAPARDRRGLPSGKNLTAAEVAELRQVARDYPWVLFGVLQLAAMMEVHPDIISAVANHRDSPFYRELKKSRPERIHAFLENPPSDFGVK